MASPDEFVEVDRADLPHRQVSTRNSETSMQEAPGGSGVWLGVSLGLLNP